MLFVDKTFDNIKSIMPASIRARFNSWNDQEAILDLLHFLARSIPQRERKVVISRKLLNNDTPVAVNQIRHELATAGDLKPWLHKKLDAKKFSHASDMLFNDWCISHFHLGGVFVDRFHKNRTANLLFAHIDASRAILICIAEHGKWANVEILRELYDIDPSILDSMELKGISPPRQGWTESEVQQLRKAGISPPIQINEKIYAPIGGGIATRAESDHVASYPAALK